MSSAGEHRQPLSLRLGSERLLVLTASVTLGLAGALAAMVVGAPWWKALELLLLCLSIASLGVLRLERLMGGATRLILYPDDAARLDGPSSGPIGLIQTPQCWLSPWLAVLWLEGASGIVHVSVWRHRQPPGAWRRLRVRCLHPRTRRAGGLMSDP